MRFQTHLLGSLGLGAVLYPRQPVLLAALVAGGTLIDLDHLLLYCLRSGDLSVVGALRYDRYRHKWLQQGDTRPRYGPLRSWLHEPLVALPACLLAAGGGPLGRALATGLGLHLLLDYVEFPARLIEKLRAGRACRVCRRSGGRIYVTREGKGPYRALCRGCAAREAGRHPPGWARPPQRRVQRNPLHT